jgi:hypothetical protein
MRINHISNTNKKGGQPASTNRHVPKIHEERNADSIARREGKSKMKRTKSMIYKPTEESRELLLCATNDGDLYRRMILPAIENLRKKAKKGNYDSDKAVDLYYYIATEASNIYNKNFGYSFSVQDRFTAAVDMEEYYREDQVFYDLEVSA